MWSTGCHAGYGIVDVDGIDGVTQTLDWAQALAREGATLVAGTGFQYGDDELIEYSERIYTEFAHQLRVGETNEPVAVGDALVKSKLAYLAATPEIKGMHQKALLTSVLFGLPMFSVNMQGDREEAPTGASIANPTPDLDGLSNDQVTVDTSGTTGHPLVDPNYFSGPDGTASNPGEPALPRVVKNVGVDGKVLRGVGFRGGAFDETTDVTPLIGAPGTEFGGAQTPFTSDTFFPARMWTTSYFGDLTGGSTNLVITPAQHQADGPGTATRRLYQGLDLWLFYVGEGDTAAAQATAPKITNIETTVAGDIVTFSANVLGDDVKAAWVTYTFGNAGCSCWSSVNLTPDSVTPIDATLWTGTLDLDGADPATLRFMVQAVNGAALVGVDDNAAAYHTLAGEAAPVKAPSALVINEPTTTSGTYGDMIEVSAHLTRTGADLASQLVTLRIGTAILTDTTDVDGVASVSLPLQDTPGATQVAATFGGNGDTLPSSDFADFEIEKLGTTLTLDVPLGDLTLGATSNVFATLLDANGDPVAFHSVVFVVSNGVTGLAKQVSTGFDGKAALGSVPSLAANSYSVAAFFNGPITLDPWAPALDQSTINLSDPIYESSFADPGDLSIKTNQVITFGAAPGGTGVGAIGLSVSATASSTLPVEFTSTTPLVCSVDGSTGALALVAVGTCTIAADQEGDASWFAAPQVTQDFMVGATITSVSPSSDRPRRGVVPGVRRRHRLRAGHDRLGLRRGRDGQLDDRRRLDPSHRVHVGHDRRRADEPQRHRHRRRVERDVHRCLNVNQGPYGIAALPFSIGQGAATRTSASSASTSPAERGRRPPS